MIIFCTKVRFFILFYGNVSFYNQSPNRAVNPTPTIGMLGVIEDVQNKMTLDFKNESDLIYQIGASKNDISSSEYLFNYHKVELSPAPYFMLQYIFYTSTAEQMRYPNRSYQFSLPQRQR